MRMTTDETPDPVERWCVGTEDGQCYVLDFAGNGGFGPVNVRSNGLLVPVVWRHHFQRDDTGCPVCADPMLANTYLPSIQWVTADSLATGEPGSGDPDRGAFDAIFRGGPDYRRMWVDVFRRDWWHTWRDYAQVDLDPRGDWRSAFDNWRRLSTGYLPDPAGRTEDVAGAIR